MKKIISITLMLIIALTLNAQINTNIWGLAIGKSTKRQVISVLQKKGYKYEITKKGTNVQEFSIFPRNGIDFAGSQWEYVLLSLYKNTLYGISFQNYKYTSAIDIYKTFNLIKYRLDQKYSSYFTNSEDYNLNYIDGETWINLSIYGEDKYLGLEYFNLKIFSIVFNEETNEL